MSKFRVVTALSAISMLCSCDLSQIPGLDGRLSIEDSKAIGAACRHAGRALEDCFVLNPKGHQSGIFDGWKEMNDYMLSNQIEVVKPEIPITIVRPEQENAAGEDKHGKEGKDTAHADKSSSAESKEEAHVASQGRPRWTPKPAGAVQRGDGARNAHGDSSEGSMKSETVKEAPETKPRPWERKKEASYNKSNT